MLKICKLIKDTYVTDILAPKHCNRDKFIMHWRRLRFVKLQVWFLKIYWSVLITTKWCRR